MSLRVGWLSWLESRTCGINQRVVGSSPTGGARSHVKCVTFLLLKESIIVEVKVFN
jgi:hypothetical protein